MVWVGAGLVENQVVWVGAVCYRTRWFGWGVSNGSRELCSEGSPGVLVPRALGQP